MVCTNPDRCKHTHQSDFVATMSLSPQAGSTKIQDFINPDGEGN